MSTAAPAVGVIGGGRMGAGIAQSFAQLGSAVTVVETFDPQAALGRVKTGLDRAHERGKLDGADPAEVLARVSVVDAIDKLPGGLDLVVEAVPEDASLKVGVLTAAEGKVGDGAILASNRSPAAS